MLNCEIFRYEKDDENDVGFKVQLFELTIWFIYNTNNCYSYLAKFDTKCLTMFDMCYNDYHSFENFNVIYSIAANCLKEHKIGYYNLI